VVRAVRRIVATGAPSEAINEETLTAHLDTAGLPDPDMVIRTAGELRLSNFLLWQAAYSELYVTPVFWPDFDAEEVDKALAEYASRTRKFGAVPDAAQATSRRKRGTA
jgi:undecaprenyl diphosphate synthase